MARKTPPDEVLVRLYVKEHKTMVEIAAIAGVSAKNVYKYLKRLKINRSRHEATRRRIASVEVVRERFKKDIKLAYHWVRRIKAKPINTVFCQKCSKPTVKYNFVYLSGTSRKTALKYCDGCYLLKG